MTRDDDWIVVATDGSCRARGGEGPMGWSWVCDDGTWASNGFHTGTNQRAELWGLLSALINFPEGPLRLEMDSQYAIGVGSAWAANWHAKGWRLKGEQRPSNLDLVVPIYELVSERSDPLELVWVQGHAAHRLNVEADRRATDASARAREVASEEDSLGLYLDHRGRTSNRYQHAMMADVISGNTFPELKEAMQDNDLFAGIF